MKLVEKILKHMSVGGEFKILRIIILDQEIQVRRAFTATAVAMVAGMPLALS